MMESKNLNPLVWDVKNKLHEPIRKKLIVIAKKFLEDIEVPIDIENIYLTGSLCSYEWSEESDWDLHIIVSPEKGYCGEITVQDYFDTKSKLFNKEHDIYIKGYPVEVNLKEKEVLLKDKAVYDLIKDEWVAEPVHPETTLNSPEVLEKTKEMQIKIKNAIEQKADIKELKALRDEIKNLRTKGLESDGEFSVGNLVFKNLRHSGYIGKLYEYKGKIQDAALSLESFASYFNFNNTH
jgi:predicted nucleotidyltransferase